jgi:DNA polymerase-3 subunit epsilon
VIVGNHNLNQWLKWLGLFRHETLKKNRQFFFDFSRNQPIENYDFVVFDTELTGLKPRSDEIVSIGAVKVHNLRVAIGKNFFCYAKPSKPLPKDSTLIHRITPSQIGGAGSLQESLPDFIDFLYGTVVVGHFVNIDISFLNRATRAALGGVIKNPLIDTMKMARFYEDFRRRNYYEAPTSGFSFNLNQLAKKYGLPLFEKHDALEDAMQTAYLFIFLVKRLKGMGISTLRDLLVAQDRTGFSSDQDAYTA